MVATSSAEEKPPVIVIDHADALLPLAFAADGSGKVAFRDLASFLTSVTRDGRLCHVIVACRPAGASAALRAQGTTVASQIVLGDLTQDQATQFLTQSGVTKDAAEKAVGVVGGRLGDLVRLINAHAAERDVGEESQQMLREARSNAALCSSRPRWWWRRKHSDRLQFWNAGLIEYSDDGTVVPASPLTAKVGIKVSNGNNSPHW
mmetsp:Transcript_33973/g.79547  ORF Transcript_33973/g.79547 Transcript_33973/m.79547 type:complete len:205 (+) Transcript_33973:109-723(+)